MTAAALPPLISSDGHLEVRPERWTPHMPANLREKAPRISAAGSLAAKTWHPKRARLNIFAQHDMLAEAFPETQPRAEDVPIANGCGCTLLELGQEECRWPVSNAGVADFRFCGNTPVKGFPYCLGHARIAYRPAGRRRSA